MRTQSPGPILKSLPNSRREVKPVTPLSSNTVTGFIYPSVTDEKLRGRNKSPCLVLAKTGPVSYKIQYSAGAEPELVHVDKLLPYLADFGEELQCWLQDEELGGHEVAGMQTDQPVSPSNPLPEPSTSTHTASGSSLEPGGYESGNEVEDEQPLILTGAPRCSHRSYLQCD